MAKVILTGLLLVLSNLFANACSCEDPGTVKEAFKSASLVVYGRVISTEYVTFGETMKAHKAKLIKRKLKNNFRMLQIFESEFIVKVKIEIIDKFKGRTKRDTITIYTTRNGASCGFTRFKKGEEYIIYASSSSYAYDFFSKNDNELNGIEKKKTFWTNQCTRTKEFNASEAKELESISKS